MSKTCPFNNTNMCNNCKLFVESLNQCSFYKLNDKDTDKLIKIINTLNKNNINYTTKVSKNDTI